MDFKKGDVIIVDFGEENFSEKSGVRPAVVLSNNIMNEKSSNIIVAPLTNSDNKIRVHGDISLSPVQLYMSNKYYKEIKYNSIVQLEDIRSISKKRVKRHVTKLSSQNYNEVNNKLKVLLDLNF